LKKNIYTFGDFYNLYVYPERNKYISRG
jgi:hypothetical protein